MKTYRLDELALLSEDRAVQAHFDSRNYRVWRILAAVLAVPSLILLINHLADGDALHATLAGLNLVVIGLLWSQRRQPWFARHFRPLLLGFIILEFILAVLAANPDGDVVLSYFFFPLLLCVLRLRASEYVLLVVTFGAMGGLGVIWNQDELVFTALLSQLVGLTIPPLVVLVVALLLARRARRDFLARWRTVGTRERDRLRMRDELADARRIQLSMLPEAAPRLDWLELSGSSLPATEVGGDFYDYLPLDDGRMVVVLGDVAGHGVSSGLVLASVKAGLHLLRDELGSPVEVLERLHLMIRETVRWRVIVTLAAAVFDPREGTLTVVTAGHPPLLHHRGGMVRAIGAPSLPLGTGLPPQLVERCVPLQEGDLVVLYSDGATELADLKERQLGEEGLADALRRSVARQGEDSASAVRESLLSMLSRHKSDAPQRDDITLVVARLGEVPGERPGELPATPAEDGTAGTLP